MGLFDRVLCGVDGTPAADAAAAIAARVAAVEPTHHADGAPPAGPPADALLREIERRGASLVVVGARAHSRAVGIALGAVSTFLLHEAPCSVLVVPEGTDHPDWPRSVVVGVDGSPESTRALEVARELSARFDADLRVIAATREAGSDVEAARAVAPEVEELAGSAVDELAHAGETADLVVVGSRGLTGIRALGSVSERVAHEAPCPVLVVRGLP